MPSFNTLRNKPCIYPEKTVRYAPQCSLQHYLQQPRHESNLEVPLWRNKLRIQCCRSYSAGCNCGTSSIPGPGNFTCHKCSQKKKKKKNQKTQKRLKYPSTEEQIKKMWYIYATECYSAIKKNKIRPFTATCMDLELPY